MTDTCVCGGSPVQPNPDCERCELIARIAKLTTAYPEPIPFVAVTTPGSPVPSDNEVHVIRQGNGMLYGHIDTDTKRLIVEYDSTSGDGIGTFSITMHPCYASEAVTTIRFPTLQRHTLAHAWATRYGVDLLVLTVEEPTQ